MRWGVVTGICLIALASLTTTRALADKRVALVIGNSAYLNVPKLSNPERDAEAMAALLRHAGFDSVQLESNLSIGDMRRVIRDFSDQTRDADTAVIYYAGHGLEAGGANYLIPIDATLHRDIDVEDEAVPLDRLLQVTERAKRLRLLILDACRDNPFTNSIAHTMASRAIGRGLARIEPSTSNTLVAYAAKAGSTAADGDGPHSPFALALLKSLVIPDLDIRLALGRVRDDVVRATTGKQEPFVYGSLGGDTVTLASLTTQDRQDRPITSDPDLLASRDYEAAGNVGTKEGWESFLQKYPKGLYADLAKAQLKKLEAGGKKERLAPASASEQPKPNKNPRQRGTPNNAAYQQCMAGYRATANGDMSYYWARARTVCNAVARNPTR